MPPRGHGASGSPRPSLRLRAPTYSLQHPGQGILGTPGRRARLSLGFTVHPTSAATQPQSSRAGQTPHSSSRLGMGTGPSGQLLAAVTTCRPRARCLAAVAGSGGMCSCWVEGSLGAPLTWGCGRPFSGGPPWPAPGVCLSPATGHRGSPPHPLRHGPGGVPAPRPVWALPQARQQVAGGLPESHAQFRGPLYSPEGQ